MAIDACILNFARIKDELYEGKSVKTANKHGNKNSFMTILDANLTTLIVAIILFVLGESTIKGFATMLIISIFVTMVIMVFFNRKLLNLFVETGMFDNKPNLFIGVKAKDIPNASKGEKRTKNSFAKLDFVHRRHLFMGLSLIVTIIGIIALSTSGLKLGIDFKGGTSITLMTDEEITEKQITEDISSLDYNLEEITMLEDGCND